MIEFNSVAIHAASTAILAFKINLSNFRSRSSRRPCGRQRVHHHQVRSPSWVSVPTSRPTSAVIRTAMAIRSSTVTRGAVADQPFTRPGGGSHRPQGSHVFHSITHLYHEIRHAHSPSLSSFPKPPNAHLDAHSAAPTHRAVDACSVRLTHSTLGSVAPCRETQQSRLPHPKPSKQL